jgi:hypothetical protein
MANMEHMEGFLVKSTTVKNIDSSPILIRGPPEVGAREERRALVFYCKDMTPSLLATNMAARNLWGPQASQSEAAVRHMLVACSSWAEKVTASLDDKHRLHVWRDSIIRKHSLP